MKLKPGSLAYLAWRKSLFATWICNPGNAGHELKPLAASRVGLEDANHVSSNDKGKIVFVADGQLRILVLWVGRLDVWR
jgi:hypothetical protein